MRQKTKGAEALELIIKESFYQNKDGVISDSAIAVAQNRFGTFTEDGSRIIYPWMTKWNNGQLICYTPDQLYQTKYRDAMM